MSMEMEKKAQKRKGGAEKLRERRQKKLKVDAAKCAKITEMFSTTSSGAGAAGPSSEQVVVGEEADEEREKEEEEDEEEERDETQQQGEIEVRIAIWR